MKYAAHVTGREGRWWAVSIPALGEDARTQARRLADVEDEARDFIAVTLDVAPSTVDVEMVIDDFGSAHEVQERSAWIRDVRRQIELLETEVREATKVLALELSSEGVPMRDIATLVGTTFQRVGQLVGEHDSGDLDTVRQDAIRQIQGAATGLHDLGKGGPLWDLAFPAPAAVALPKRATTDEMLSRVADYMIFYYGIGRSHTMVRQLATRLGKDDVADRAGAVEEPDFVGHRGDPRDYFIVHVKSHGTGKTFDMTRRKLIAHITGESAEVEERWINTFKYLSEFAAVAAGRPDPYFGTGAFLQATVDYLATHTEAVEYVATKTKQHQSDIYLLVTDLQRHLPTTK